MASAEPTDCAGIGGCRSTMSVRASVATGKEHNQSQAVPVNPKRRAARILAPQMNTDARIHSTSDVPSGEINTIASFDPRYGRRGCHRRVGRRERGTQLFLDCNGRPVRYIRLPGVPCKLFRSVNPFTAARTCSRDQSPRDTFPAELGGFVFANSGRQHAHEGHFTERDPAPLIP